ncbi:hypothetical protein HispidOSU_007760, partial [Sigmodon hispidus]
MALGYLHIMDPLLVGMIDNKTLDLKWFHRVQSQKPGKAGNLEEISYGHELFFGPLALVLMARYLGLILLDIDLEAEITSPQNSKP